MRSVRVSVVASAMAAMLLPMAAAWAAGGSFIGRFHSKTTVASTVPRNGDVNPYGVAVVPRSEGRLVRGDVLVSNFNNSANLQGTGTTIVQISPDGSRTLFAHIAASALPGPCPGGVGLTTALVVLRSGWVIVGSLPTRDGTAVTAKAGCLIVVKDDGEVAETFSGRPINGPWDMTAFDAGATATLFVTNVLNGTVAAGGATVHKGTVLRIGLDLTGMPSITSKTIIGSKFGEHSDPAALVVGPTGLGLGADGTLYVADTVANRIAAIPDAMSRPGSAGTGTTVTTGGSLNSPLGLAMAPNADVLTVNGGDGLIVETAPSGAQVAMKMLDSSGSPPGAGALFGLAVTPQRDGVYFVDDATNRLRLLH